MTKAFWTSVLMLAGLACIASPALAQGPKQTADKVRNQIERRDRVQRDQVQRHDRDDARDDDRDRVREHRERHRDIFVRDEDRRPPGWDRGKKVGWGDCDVPPGLAKKQGCHSFHHEPHHTVSRTTSHPVIVRRPRAEAHAQVDAKVH